MDDTGPSQEAQTCVSMFMHHPFCKWFFFLPSANILKLGFALLWLCFDYIFADRVFFFKYRLLHNTVGFKPHIANVKLQLFWFVVMCPYQLYFSGSLDY